MDPILTLLLVIVGVIIIGFIYFDAKRRQRLRQEKRDQRLFEQHLDNTKDNGDFDIDGIGEVRLVGSAQEKAKQAAKQETVSKTQATQATEHLEPDFGDDAQVTDSSQDAQVPVLDDMLFGFDKDKLEEQAQQAPRKEPKIAQPKQTSLFEEQNEPKVKVPEPELIFTLYLVSASEAPYQGEQLVQTLLDQGMRHGDMNIFHRHSQATGRGPIQFSLANAYDPGTFNLDKLDQLETKGLAVFMALPGPKKPIKAYEMMVATSKAIVQELGGYIIDSSKAHFSRQIEAHHKEQIQEFERRQLLKQS